MRHDIAVHCAHAEMVDVCDLVPNPKNPNRHPPDQIALLAKNIKSLGWRHPVIVSRRSGMVVAGHARIEAARVIGANAVPVDYQDFATPEKETAYLLADNRIAELAERDATVINDLLEELKTCDIDMDLTGYRESIDELMMQPAGDEQVATITPITRMHVLLSMTADQGLSSLAEIEALADKIGAEVFHAGN